MALLAGVALAAGASLLYNLGLVVQAEAARREPTGSGLDGRLLVRLLGRARWLAGTGLVVAGWPLQALALTRAPLTVVQPALAVGLVLPLAVGALRLGERVRARDVAAVAAVAAGVSLVVASAPPRSDETSTWLRTGVALAVVATLTAGALVLARSSRHRGQALVAAAGLAFAGASLATKLLADDFARHTWLPLVGWGAATAVAGGVGTLAETNALQVRSAGGVAALVFSLETVVPVALSPLLFGETWGASAGAVAARAAGLALAVAGAVELTRAGPVVQALAEG